MDITAIIAQFKEYYRENSTFVLMVLMAAVSVVLQFLTPNLMDAIMDVVTIVGVYVASRMINERKD